MDDTRDLKRRRIAESCKEKATPRTELKITMRQMRKERERIEQTREKKKKEKW